MTLELLSLNLSSTVIGSIVCIIVLFISYLVYRFGIAEKSFEEAIEEQKRRSIEEELKQKSEKVKKEKKFKKTWGKKSKEKAELEVPSETVQIPETKDVATDIEIIELKEVKPITKQKNKPKSVSSNQQPSNASSASNQQPSNASPVQEKTKKRETSPVLEKPVEEKKIADEAEKVKSESQVVEPIKPVEVKEIVSPSAITSVQTASQPGTAVQKKKKVEKDTVVPLTTNKLMSFIRESELEAEEIQSLIDALLNKQKDSTGWTKKNDTLALTKKNLHEKELLLDQEQRQNQAITAKLKDLREEYNLFKSKFSAQEKASQEKLSRQQQDIQVLTAKVKQVQDQLTAEKEKFTQIEKENEKKFEASIKKLEEDKAKLSQKITRLETESRIGASVTEFETLKKSKEDLQKVHTLVVEQHTQLVTTHKTDLKNLHAQLTDAKAQIEELNAQNIILSKDIQTLTDSKSAAELAKRTVEDKLKAEEKRCADLEAQIKQLTAKVTDFGQLQAELKDLRLENERLADQLVASKERVAGDGQEIVHQNGELNGKAQEVSLQVLDEKEKILKEKEKILVQLNEDLAKQKAKVDLLNEEIENQKQKNNELREKNWKAMEALTNAEQNAEQRIKEMQMASDQKIAQLEKDFAVLKQQTSANSEAFQIAEKLKEIESEAAQRLSDYNKEVEKNRQLSSELDRINELRKSSDLRIAEMQKNVEELKSDLLRSESITKESLQRICPSISIDSSLSLEEWVLEFGKQATNIINWATLNKESQKKMEELLEEKEKEYLQKQTHYERVLAETESTLLKLQERAESQDTVWQERLKSKEDQFEQIKSERDALIAEKEAMQSTFQQLSQLEELREKLKLLQSTLETSEQKYEEVQKNCLNLRDQLENKEIEIAELQQKSNSLDKLNKEIEDLRAKLEKEKKINKDFSSQMIKLSSLVKIGEDSLKAEQETVKKLKSQLETIQVSTANGTASATISSSVTNNESPPKTKNSEKSKKKMDALDKK